MAQTVNNPNSKDTQQIKQQLAVVDQLLLKLGELPLDQSLDDCKRLQAVLDAGVLKATDTYQLQSLGLALGNVISSNLGLDWVMVEDEYGRDPALRYRNTSLILFPLTMISKRVERGEAVNVPDLYAITSSHVKQLANEVN